MRPLKSTFYIPMEEEEEEGEEEGKVGLSY
jgi:hypothetical protein